MRRGRTRGSRLTKKSLAPIIVTISIIFIVIFIGLLILKNNEHKKTLQIAEQQRQEEISKIFEEEKATEEIEEISNHIKPSKVKIKIASNI